MKERRVTFQFNLKREIEMNSEVLHKNDLLVKCGIFSKFRF